MQGAYNRSVGGYPRLSIRVIGAQVGVLILQSSNLQIVRARCFLGIDLGSFCLLLWNFQWKVVALIHAINLWKHNNFADVGPVGAAHNEVFFLQKSAEGVPVMAKDFVGEYHCVGSWCRCPPWHGNTRTPCNGICDQCCLGVHTKGRREEFHIQGLCALRDWLDDVVYLLDVLL